jgi:hypothetical protein
MQKRKSQAKAGSDVEKSELVQELEKLMNENNALMKVLEKISPGKLASDKHGNDMPGSDSRGSISKKGKDSIK